MNSAGHKVVALEDMFKVFYKYFFQFVQLYKYL